MIIKAILNRQLGGNLCESIKVVKNKGRRKVLKL